MRQLYSLVFYLLLPLVLLRMLWRSRRAPAYRRRLGERLGWFSAPVDGRPAIWVHAVSVGETLAAAPLVEALLARYPAHRLVVTTTTPTGSERLQSLFGERIFHVYAPWDTPGAVRRFLRRVRPDVLLLMETELWPNMLHYSAASGLRIVLANARLSARSARGYQRVAALSRAMLGHLDRVACQAKSDGERFLALGLPASRLAVTGSIKFDLDLEPRLREEAAALRRQFGERFVLLAASTHRGEDEQVLAAFARLRERRKDSCLVLVPRHPERFEEVLALCRREGWHVARRSAGEPVSTGHDVLLGDTMGELLRLLGCADLAVVGGSLVPHGGHNMLEAAAWGVPVVTGPYVFNFARISELLEASGAMIRLGDESELSSCLVELAADSERRQAMGAAGREVVAANRGARERLLALLGELLPPP